MPKISFSGERPEPFDGMMMSYDAKSGREEKEAKRKARKVDFIKESTSTGEAINIPESVLKMQDMLESQETINKFEIASIRNVKKATRKVDNTRNRIRPKKGQGVATRDVEGAQQAEKKYNNMFER